MRPSAALLVAALIALSAGPASADDPDYFGGGEPEGVRYLIEKDRTPRQRIIIGSLAGAGAVFGGLGILFHLDSRSASDEVSAVGEHTGRTYTSEIDDERDRAIRSRNLAVVGYALGGAFLVSSVVALVLTEPEAEVVTVGTERQVTSMSVVPVPGGAVVGKRWSF